MNISIKLNSKTLIIIGLITLSLFVIFSCSTGSSKTNDAESNAIALPVQQIDTATAITVKDYLGTIEGKVNVEIRPQVEGILEEIYVDEGAVVKEGQKLFKINPQPYQEQLNNAIANENVEKAKLENAKLEVDRLKPLVENDVISDVRLRAALSDYDVAKASLAQASAAVASARINLGFTTIKAPVSGFIGRIPKRVGNLVSSSDPLTELSDISEVYVYFAMSESDFLYFRKKYGKSDSTSTGSADTAQLIPNVSLVMADGTVYPEKGVVDAINGQVNRTTGSISLRATFPNKDHVLRSGNTGTLKMEERQRSVLTVPQVATTELQDKIFVYTLQPDNRVKQQAIEVTGKSGKQYIVKNGIKPGDRIVLSGLDKLENGMEIKPLTVPSASAE
ncbi:efflux RND transporter periplasmic adaptor subunit [Parapedobacter indicus]|uniref:Membrane fusion protein, multidrug efflux system n=1 Tax=Parapedobacter indicus TaxID=1477437 RepID=A0A1I3CR46_9SPHI|nr:efflux RND transporter periplasmic adaptor subunit [Parapedobacter indicus]PPL04353.1 membrane fusion protein (multidrug efflux system) [Parapedobacter indicus]SFH76729.1 membrane fusion protein, multidrug efflux system [Parapedobacter indicus]